MQDISLIPEWNKQEVIQGLEKNPLDHKVMKSKLDKIYQITSANELEYLPDVLDAYCWIKLATEMDDFKKFFPTEKNQKQFYEDFVSTAIRYMVICKRFKNKVLMVLTQYIMVESLRLFTKKFGSLQKYLKMITMLTQTFDHEKQFYQINYVIETVNRVSSHRGISDIVFDDSNDQKNDPQMKQRFVMRGDICSSQLFLDLLNYAHNQLDLFNMLLQSVITKKFNIEATSEVISFLMNIHKFFHRKWALEYIHLLTKGILDYINNGDEITIRNFSKQRYEAVISSVRQFLKRVSTTEQKKKIVEQFQLNLVRRFLFSDFLDRKLQAVSILATFMKNPKNTLVMSKQQFVQWIKTNQILKAIYNDKSHDELIGRSTEFLQYYLLQKPPIEELDPLLQLNDANIKLISEIFQYFPKQFQNSVVNKIKQKENVTNKEALNIIKQTSGCEEWLLKNGGDCWVEVMREKTKRKADIVLVFHQNFKVVKKITKQISDLFEGKFKTQFFIYMNEINYVATVLQNQSIPLGERLQYAALALDPLQKINEKTYKALLPLTTKTIDNLNSDIQTFFVNLPEKLSQNYLRDLFQQNFSSIENLTQIGLGQLALFKKCFILINEQEKNIEKKTTYSYISPHNYRKQKKQHLTVKVNPNLLTGMTQLMQIIFENKNIAVSQEALQFIGFLFDRLDETLIDLAAEFKSKILDSCLQEFYKTEDQQQKYLKIIEKLMNQSEKQGVDKIPSVNSLFPVQMITIRIIDHFNVNKSKITIEVPSNYTLYELRTNIGRTINAYVNEMKISQNNEQIDPRLNGHIIHTLNFGNGDLIVEKKITIQKVSLCQPDGGLNEKAKRVLLGMFKQYSTLGLMSKAQCQKYQQRCIGEITSMSQSRVDKIYDQYDTDKDGYLSEADFLKFYEVSVASKQPAVWSNLETFGVRNDLEILTDQEVVYPDGALLTRNLLWKNDKFTSKLVLMIQSSNEQEAQAAWNIICRLPLIQKPLNEFNVDQKYSFRYWLLLVEDLKQYKLVTKDILKKALQSDIETACIGLKIAHECTEFNIEIFKLTITNMNKIVSQESLQFYNKVLLDNSLKLFDSCLRMNKDIRNQFIQNQEEYSKNLTIGLLNNKSVIRSMYCKTVEKLINETFQADFQIFQILFNLITKNFQQCDKSTLNIDYFDLYSNLLEILQTHTQLYQKLKLNENILAKSMVQIYKEHRCTQTGLNSKPDHVSQGFLRILGKLLNKETQEIMVPFIDYLFKNNLFPEHGQNKLKNSKTRKDAYELIYKICSLRNENEESLGLKRLFEAGFKQVYKKMNQSKPTTISFSYYYNYNQARSELGYAGIRNLGCICYMIAMLQQLFMTKAFRYLILMADDRQPQNIVKKGSKQIDDNIFHQLKNMFANLQLTEKQQYNPEEFCFAFKDFDGQPINVTVQQDAQQFINLFFDKMEQSLKKTPFRRIFSDIYGGRNCNLTVCSNCNAANERYENFYPLSLEIKGHKSIQDSFRKYITGEVISDYQCDSCKKKADVTKSCYLANTPNYFIIHLTRMCFNYDKFQNEKVNSRWQFPHKLNLWEYSLDKLKGNLNSKDDFEYKLKGIVLHYGTADFGHYFSYVKQSQTQWVQFNDERVRQFDPRDIQTDCFGGQNWRRQSQSAYLLVYEKVKKRPIILQFQTEEEKQLSLRQFGLKKAVIEPEPKIQTKDEQRLVEQESKQKESEIQLPKKPQEIQKPKILVTLDPMKIPVYVPDNIRNKISKQNQDFSFSLNLSNDEFAYFLYKILSIQPPDELTTEYLELCYECFYLKQVIEESSDDGTSLSLSEWAAKRFKQIVKGHGWQFMKNFGKNWQSDILSMQKSTRVGIKNLLECVISDIIQSNNLNNELVEQVGKDKQMTQQKEQLIAEKRQIILQFLEKYTEMLGNQVTKHWHRFKQYFEVWLTLVEQNSFVRRYCEQNMMIEKIMDFILEDQSPFTRTKKKYSMAHNYYSADFQYPLQFLTILINHGYDLNEMQINCMKCYAFLSKIINFQTKHFNLVQYLCKDDEIMSEKMAYLILNQATRVHQSDGIKPIVNVIHKYLDIKDNLKQKRIQWILGIPQHIQNSKTGSFGIYNVDIQREYILTYYSPVRAPPILLQLIRFKPKAHHVAALLLSMIIQLQHDGHITNLEAYPSMEAFEKDYTHWFDEFIESYYEESHRPYMAKMYVDYGNRLKALWTERPNRPFQKSPFYLIGKTQKIEFISKVTYQDRIELKLQNITSSILQITKENGLLNKKYFKTLPGSQNFRFKTNYYSHSSILPLEKGLHSSDEEQAQDKPLVNPFDKRFDVIFFRKCTIKNLTNQNLLVTFKVVEEGETNTVLPESTISFDVHSDSTTVIPLHKKDVTKDFGNLKFQINVLGLSTKEGYWPRHIITPIIEEDKVAAPDAKVNSDDDSNEEYP